MTIYDAKSNKTDHKYSLGPLVHNLNIVSVERTRGAGDLYIYRYVNVHRTRSLGGAGHTIRVNCCAQRRLIMGDHFLLSAPKRASLWLSATSCEGLSYVNLRCIVNERGDVRRALSTAQEIWTLKRDHVKGNYRTWDGRNVCHGCKLEDHVNLKFWIFIIVNSFCCDKLKTIRKL